MEGRDLKSRANSFIPAHEKEWDARLFTDKAIKDKAEDHLEIICKSLSGGYKIKIQAAKDPKGFERKFWIKSDDDTYITKTEYYKFEAKMDKYVFNGNNHSEIYLAIIKFWVSGSIFPCGGASYNYDK